MSYSDELKNMREQRRKVFAIGFSLIVFLPTLIATIYYGLIASPLYTSVSKFTLTVEGASSIGASLTSGIGSLLMGTGSSANIQEAYIVKEYITSQDMVETLKKKIDLYGMYNSPKADFLAKPPVKPTIEEFVEYYNKMVTVRLDPQSGMMILEVDAFSSNDAQIIANHIFQEAEHFVNKRSDRIQRDSVKFAERFLKESEEKVLEANITLSEFRNKNKNFDPAATASGVLAISARLEAELVKTKTEISTLSNFLKSDNPRIEALSAKARSIEAQLASQSNRLASSDGSALADITQEYEAHKLISEFSVKRYGMALVGYEEARSVARKQKKYLVRVVGPTLSEESLKPAALYEVASVLFVCLVIYVLGGLMISSLRDHIRV